MFIVIIYRFIFSLFILRFPLFGGIVAAVSEFIDLNLLKIFEPTALTQYQKLDKTLDLFYLGLEAFIASSWQNNLVRKTALTLFFVRLTGTVLFNLSGNPILLVLFPNIFEWFYLTYLSFLLFFKKDYFQNIRIIALVIFILAVPKFIHEFYLHVYLPDKHLPELFMNLLSRFNLLF